MNKLTQLISRIYSHRHFNLIASCLIALAVLIAYANTFTAAFQFDDEAHIHENPAVKAVTWENVKTLLRTTRPVTDLSLMFNYAACGLDVVGWHAFNTALHIANSVMVYFLVLATLLLPVFRGKYEDKARGMALFIALLFAVHPIQTESVTYIISRSELLAAFFFLGALLFFIRGAESGRFLYYMLTFLSSLFAMGSKEWAATLPVVVLLYDYLFLSEGRIREVVRRWKAYLLLVLPWLLAAYILSLYRGATSAGFSITGVYGITPWTYLLTSLNVIWTYVRLLVLPINQNLDYDYPLATTLFEFPTMLSFLGHVAVVAVSILLYKKKGWRLAPFGVAWFYLILAPTQSFVPIIDVIFEHRLYLSSLGLFLAFAAGMNAVFSRFERPGTVVKSSA